MTGLAARAVRQQQGRLVLHPTNGLALHDWRKISLK